MSGRAEQAPPGEQDPQARRRVPEKSEESLWLVFFAKEDGTR